MQELKPCPFCGQYSAVVMEDHRGFEVVCDNPDCPDMSDANWTRDFAIELWSRRPIEDALRASLASLERINEGLKERLREMEKFAEQEDFECGEALLSALSQKTTLEICLERIAYALTCDIDMSVAPYSSNLAPDAKTKGRALEIVRRHVLIKRALRQAGVNFEEVPRG